jgi:DNA polymerase III epsilon subunit-like protein
MKNTIENDVLFFDAETTGLPEKGAQWETDFKYFPNIASLAWIFRGVEKHYIVYPDGWTIPQVTTDIHGITTEYALEHGVKIDIVLADFAEDILKAPFVAAHNIYFDSSVVKANVLKHIGRQFYDEMRFEDGLHKGKRIDTMMKTIKFVGALYANGRPGKFPKLEELHEKLFPGEKFEAHNSLEDCKALQRCLPELVNLGIITLALKEYPGEQTKAEPVSTPQNKIEFNQPPVEMPDMIVDDPNQATTKEQSIEAEKYFNEAIKEQPKTGLSATERKPNNPLLDIDEF